MKIFKSKIFNLMDTNGRRKDILNAYYSYLTILDELSNEKTFEWNKLPYSYTQFIFYKFAIEKSQDVFVTHASYDKVINYFKNNKKLKNILDDYEKLTNFYHEFNLEIKKLINLGIEDRSRHYTSNLVKLGFILPNRKLSDNGISLIKNKPIKRDILEERLDIDDNNLIYFRQLLKLKIFNQEETVYYSPFIFAIYILLKCQYIEENKFLQLVQSLNPYVYIDDFDKFIDEYNEQTISHLYDINIPIELQNDDLVSEEIFYKYFKNQKSKKITSLYWLFYNYLYEFSINSNFKNYEKLYNLYYKNNNYFSKSFIKIKKLFTLKENLEEFKHNFNKMFKNELNKTIFQDFYLSKIICNINEYSDTTKRIFKTCGLISFNNGIASLKDYNLLKYVFDVKKLKEQIIKPIHLDHHNKYDNYLEYEGNNNSYFYQSHSLTEILDYDIYKIDKIILNIQNSNFISIDRNEEFKKYIITHYPINFVKKILILFKDRKNYSKIKKMTSSDANIPTLFEYFIGIAWFYFSGNKINLLDSLNMTMTANFEPLFHASHGKADIVINENDSVNILEVTLMNSQNQKHSEWEPVLRHSINTKIEVEKNDSNKKVTSFFIANEFDFNTINIWRAVSSVTLQSSTDKNLFTSNLVIVPISIDDLIKLIDKSDNYKNIIELFRRFIIQERDNFSLNWREELIDKVLKS